MLLFVVCVQSAFAQKMLLLERANRARTTRYYPGDGLTFRFTGTENYWYRRTITDILPASNSLLLDNFAVKLSDIQTIKVRRKSVWRIIGGASFSFGASLALATTIGRLGYRDKSIDALSLYSVSAASLGLGWYLNTPRKLRLGEKHRLRIVEISFSQ